ncbi:uncharacterized protein LOC119334071 [Triticum dicoccoides]|uniref:Uncharacterized protein n=1 Tax=Triticum turgidum subsp. durum TaxID=4567 RepID=A0A9R0ZNC6_TRITD|nr:uncharacterized protein LOC119334071 [Triticum dicoccoides]VAI79879.1 unnamed protein product [Triticum turgidum subsp. durum]
MEFTLKSTEVLEKAATLAADALGLEGEARGAWGAEEKARALERWAKICLEVEKGAVRGKVPVAPVVAGPVPRAEDIGSDVNHVGDGGDPSISAAVQDAAIN